MASSVGANDHLHVTDVRIAKMQAQFGFSDEDILSQEFVLCEEEILAEFWAQCAAAADRGL